MATSQLGDLLAEVVPKDAKINARHVSTTPTRCEAIFSAPPGDDPEATFCESHFLLVSLNRYDAVNDEIAILGIEVYIYTTERLTTLFVSKADSTGYVHLLKGGGAPAPSLLRSLTTVFLSYLSHSYQRPGVRLVLSLFARAQDQYLFPGSVDNKRKHVLDDRGLIKWWCRAVDPILREHAAESQESSDNKAASSSSSSSFPSSLDEKVECLKSSATAYLLVPGCDRYETRAFFPPTAGTDNSRWRVSYPLSQICGHAQNAPPRCLVPRFPDDPKARFLTDLDDELSENAGSSETFHSGQWRSVKSLDQFWEMMSFRQECSAGRLVGFLWLVINPPGVLSSDKLETQTTLKTGVAVETTKDAVDSDIDAPATTAAEAKFDDRALSSRRNGSQQQPTAASGTDVARNPFFWPEAGRGEVILSGADYKSANDILLEQDFETEELAMAGTMAWVRKVASLADVLWWGNSITGKREVVAAASQLSLPVQPLHTELHVRKRKKDVQEAADAGSGGLGEDSNRQPGVNVLNANFIRKRRRHDGM